VHDDDNPPLTPSQLGRAVRHRGRPRGNHKSRATVRIDTDVVAWLKKSGNVLENMIYLAGST
jgi:uncharacterized protein (DUF4415 family)